MNLTTGMLIPVFVFFSAGGKKRVKKLIKLEIKFAVPRRMKRIVMKKQFVIQNESGVFLMVNHRSFKSNKNIIKTSFKIAIWRKVSRNPWQLSKYSTRDKSEVPTFVITSF